MTPWPSAVIFDLDGTLADTLLDLAAALNATLAELDLSPHAPEAVRGMVGGGLEKLLDRGLAAHGAILDAETRRRAGARLLELYAASPAEHSRLYPGATDALHALRQSGVPIGVCTNKPQAIASDLLSALGVAGAFGCIRGSTGDLPKKPHPASLLLVVEGLGASPETSVMVGDSKPDIETARAAGLAGAVVVAHGYSRRPVRELGADLVIDHLADLPCSLGSLASARRLTLK